MAALDPVLGPPRELLHDSFDRHSHVLDVPVLHHQFEPRRAIEPALGGGREHFDKQPLGLFGFAGRSFGLVSCDHEFEFSGWKLARHNNFWARAVLFSYACFCRV